MDMVSYILKKEDLYSILKYLKNRNERGLPMDYLHGIDCQIIQHPDMFHANSDTELLGCFMHVKRKDRVLDIGTNNGALLLYASRFHPCYMHGIDLFEEVIETARINAEYNHIDMRFTVSSLQEFESDPFDLIVCNPPYFHTQSNHLKNENRYLRAARHEEYLSLEDLMKHVKRLLKDNGRFEMVYRPTDLFHVFTVAQKQFFWNFRRKKREKQRLNHLHFWMIGTPMDGRNRYE